MGNSMSPDPNANGFAYEGLPVIPEEMTVQEWNAQRRAFIASHNRARPHRRLLDLASGVRSVNRIEQTGEHDG